MLLIMLTWQRLPPVEGKEKGEEMEKAARSSVMSISREVRKIWKKRIEQKERHV